MGEPEVLAGRYEVVRTVSVGPRSTVVQAIDRVHDRTVALKVHPVTEDSREQLLTEAQLLMQIAPHPGLPVVRGDFFTEDQRRYVLVMNWVDGVDLQQALDDRGDPGLPLDEVIEILAQVADALDHLHAHQPPVVHGDVKPSNLVSAGGRVVLVDFDIAGAQGGEGLGTPGFVAPEVLAGDKPGPAADVYGLAATAVTLLDGEAPSLSVPSLRSVDPSLRGAIARVLRTGLAMDPEKRPTSAGRLVESLRHARRAEYPSGVVAYLALEVADAARHWDLEPDETRAMMQRLRDIRDDVVERNGGLVVTTMNEGDRTFVVFRQASAAATAAIELHERCAQERLPGGGPVQLRAALAVGEATMVDGLYTGSVVDSVVRLRALASPGSTVVAEPTAEFLVGLVGTTVSIVPLGTVEAEWLRQPLPVFGLTRPGQEHAAAAETTGRRGQDAAAPDPAGDDRQRDGRPRMAVDALLDPVTLTASTVAGVALIVLVVLAAELGIATLAATVAVGALAVAVVSFAWRYSAAVSLSRTEQEEARHEREALDRADALSQERVDTRRRLETSFAALASADGRQAAVVLEGLGDEHDAIVGLLGRAGSRPSISISPLLGDLADETYRRGMSALSDALELLEFADGPQRRRLEAELSEIEDRVEAGIYDDDRSKSRDEQRLAAHRQLLARHDDARHRTRDLVFEAERCTAALAEARIEIASVRAGDTQGDVDAVVETLQSTIRRVREVQDELRRLGYER
jgi:hypothetical protein